LLRQRIPLLRVSAVTCQTITDPRLQMMCRRVALAVTVFSSTRIAWTMRAVPGVNGGTLLLRVAVTVTLGSLAMMMRFPMTLTMKMMTSFVRLI
jgi:hypothetical protein